MTKLSVTLVMATLLGPVAFGAQTAAPAKAAMQQSKPATVSSSSMSTKPAMGKIHQVSGQIVSISDTSLVLSSGKQKKKESTFVLNQDTKREGALSTGEMAKIEYHTQAAEKVATLVQVRALKTATSKAPKSGY